MATIEIKNVGPVKEAKFDLNKINVFMGPQSSGKSTIAKIISYCTWVEKRRMLDGFFRENFLERLKSFHNLGDVYFPANAYFKYDGECCEIEFSEGEGKVVVKKNGVFENRKQIYIPAERNFVATIPNLEKYKETNNNILDFLYFWREAKKSYSHNSALHIPELSIDFQYREKDDTDVVVFGKGKELALQNSSSGVQSMLPLYIVVDYMTKVIYTKQFIPSPSEKEKLMNEVVMPELSSQIEEYIDKNILAEFTQEQQNALKGLSNKSLDKLKKSIAGKAYEFAVGCITYNRSEFIIEEPEQNLFPTTQRDLIYYMLRVMNESGRDHRLTFTTHSPYILYALNNCMMGSLVYDRMSGQDKAKLKCGSALIKPELVSIYQIENGVLKNIQDEDGLIGNNYFDDNMKGLMGDFYVMLNYYER